jgi:hypothetical protein
MIVVTETVERSSWEPSGAAESAVHDELDFGKSDIDVDIDEEGSASAASAGSDSEY